MSALASVLPRGRDWRRWAAVVTGAALAVLAVAQSSLAASFTIQARNYDFVAPAGGSGITVTVGDGVTWVASGDPHTVTSGSPAAIDHRFPDSPAGAGFLFSGETFTTTFATPGTYPYFCEVHPEQMSGVVQVLPVSTQTPTPTKTSTPSPMKTQAPTAGPTSGGSAAPTVATPTAAAPSVATPTAAAPSAVAPTAAFPSPTVLVPSALVTTTPDASVDSGVVPTPTASPISSADGSGTADPGQTQATSPSGTLIAAVAGLAITALVGLGLLSVRRRRRSG